MVIVWAGADYFVKSAKGGIVYMYLLYLCTCASETYKSSKSSATYG